MHPTRPDKLRRHFSCATSAIALASCALLSACASSRQPVEPPAPWRSGPSSLVLPTPAMRDLQGDQAVAYDHALPEYTRRDALVLPPPAARWLDDRPSWYDVRWQYDRYQVDRNQLLPVGRRVSHW